MKKQISENLFIRAEDMLESAGRELQRAEEDVVVPAVCYNSRKTIFNYLEGFLIRHYQAPTGPMSLEQLKNECAKINPGFDKIDFTHLDCKQNDELDPAEFCMSIKKVKSCYQIAQEVKDLIQNSEM